MWEVSKLSWIPPQGRQDFWLALRSLGFLNLFSLEILSRASVCVSFPATTSPPKPTDSGNPTLSNTLTRNDQSSRPDKAWFNKNTGPGLMIYFQRTSQPNVSSNQRTPTCLGRAPKKKARRQMPTLGPEASKNHLR